MGAGSAGFLNATRIFLRLWKSTKMPCLKDWIELMTIMNNAWQSKRLKMRQDADTVCIRVYSVYMY